MTFSTPVLLGCGALIAALLVPFALPKTVQVERAALIKASPADIYKLIASNTGFQTFNPYKDTDPDLEITLAGPESGIGSGFAFKGKEGEGTQFITAAIQNRSVTMQIDLGSMGRPVQTFDLQPLDGGTQVTWGMEADLGFNPVARVFGLFMEGMMGPVYERGLNNLSKATTPSA